MKKSELKQLIRETVEEVRIISEATKITAYLESNPKLVESLMKHGLLTEDADGMGRREFLKKLGLGLAGAGITAAGLKGAESGKKKLIDPYTLAKNREFLMDVDDLLTSSGVREEWKKMGWNIFEFPDYGIALEKVFRTYEDIDGNSFSRFSSALNDQIRMRNTSKTVKDHHNEDDRIFVILSGMKKVEKKLYDLIADYMRR